MKRVRGVESLSCLEWGTHPRGIRPQGELYVAKGGRGYRTRALGKFALLSYEMLVGIFGLLEAMDLARIASFSSYFYAVSSLEELWRFLVLEKFEGDFKFKRDWKTTFLHRSGITPFSGDYLRVDVHSDFLFQSWLCCSRDFDSGWLERENVSRESAEHLSRERFIHQYEKRNVPLVIEGAIQDWNALRSWNREHLINVLGNAKLSVQSVDMTMKDFFQYCSEQQDECPLYMFDYDFVKHAPCLGEDFSPPVYFQDDLFSVLGSSRPHYRWIIIGPRRSGSSFHKDPNATSAWNAVISGRKRWILFPPHIQPPGVQVSRDEALVMTPTAIMEWFMNYYEEARTFPEMLECTVDPGSVMFIPSGWWHLVVNLEESIAITQNFVSRTNVGRVMDFLENKPDQVSGYSASDSLFEDFSRSLKQIYPEIQPEPVKRTMWESLQKSPSSTFQFHFDPLIEQAEA